MANKIIKAQMKQRRDTKANWAAQNPVLLAGELGIVSDDPNLYKVGDGTTAWNALPFRGFNGTIVQETGTSENAVMSQKAVTQEISGFSELITSNAQKIYAPLQSGAPTKIALTNEGDAPITFGLSFKSEGGAETLARVETPAINKGDTYAFEIGPLEGYSYIYTYSFTSGAVRLYIYGDSLKGRMAALEEKDASLEIRLTNNSGDINSLERTVYGVHKVVFSEEIKATGQKVYAPLSQGDIILISNAGETEITFNLSYKNADNTTLELVGLPTIKPGESYRFNANIYKDYSYFLVSTDTGKFSGKASLQVLAELQGRLEFSEQITANAQKIYAPLQKNKATLLELICEEDAASFGLSFKSEGGASTIKTVTIPDLKKGEKQEITVDPMEQYSYIYSYSFTGGTVRLNVYGEPLEKKVTQLEKDIKEATGETADVNSIMIEKGILLIGASFAAANENNWFSLLTEKLGSGEYYNKAVGSTNVMFDAWRLKNGTLYTPEEFENFDVLMINHVHDKDVFTLADIVVNGKTYTGSQLKGFTAEQYEANGIIDFFASNVYDPAVSAERELYYGYREAQYYAAAFDYIFKKYRTICYAAKNNASSQWNGSTFGKPCQILLLTHWNAGRPTINTSLKKLGAKWNAPVFDLSLGLGFAPSKLLLDGTKASYNESTYYARDNEYVGNQYFGKHLQYTTAAPYPYIQRKIASVLSKILKD